MEENIQNYLPTVMFPGTPSILNGNPFFLKKTFSFDTLQREPKNSGKRLLDSINDLK